MSKCPICGYELLLTHHSIDAGLTSESMHECKHCELYSCEFLYGSSRICFGKFDTDYDALEAHHNDALEVIAERARKQTILITKWRAFWKRHSWYDCYTMLKEVVRG